MQNNNDIVGYIKCTHCNKPALWLVNDMKYEPQVDDSDNEALVVTFNFKVENFKQETFEYLGYYLCDTCGERLAEEDINEHNVVLISEESEEYH